MTSLLPLETPDAVQQCLEALGARFHLGPVLERLDRVHDGLKARLSDGQAIDCDLVVSAVGLRPRTALAEAAGIDVGQGVVVDRLLRTSAEHVYALGDCAEVNGLNLLYVMPLMSGVRALSRTLAGTPTAVSYGPMPITVKTPACPLVVSPPAIASVGGWTVEGAYPDIKALFHSPDGRLLGYALTGAATRERM